MGARPLPRGKVGQLKIWSHLAKSTQKKYAAKGVTPARYNAWVKTSKSGKQRLAKAGVTRESFLKAQSTRDAKRNASQIAAFDRLNSMLPRANPRTIRDGIESMSPTELRIALTAPIDKIRRLASRKPDRESSTGKDINPFWYR